MAKEPTKKELQAQLEEMQKQLEEAQAGNSNEELFSEVEKAQQEAQASAEEAKKLQEEFEKVKAENQKLKEDTNRYVDPDDIDLNDGKQVMLTFAPLYSAKRSMTLILKKKEEHIINGQKVITTVPAIEGLPEKWTIRYNQRVPVTKNQFKELYRQGWIAKSGETEEQKELFESIEGTFPEEFSISHGQNMYEGITSPNVIQQIYKDKLRVVE